MATKWKRSDNVVWEELDGQALLIHSATGARWTLNAAAMSLWKLCDGTRTAQALLKAVTASREELEAFVHALAGTGLLQPVGAGSVPLIAPSAHFSIGSTLRASYLGKGLIGVRRRPSPRGNSGPG